jgi:hypothetical protein
VSAGTVDATKRFGPSGSYWGNLLLPDESMAVGDTFTFGGDPAVYEVKRVLVAPLDPGKRLYYYERKNRHEAGEGLAAA